jgi:hypothetical protein
MMVQDSTGLWIVDCGMWIVDKDLGSWQLDFGLF